MSGYMISVDYGQGFSKRFGWTAGIASTIHDGSFPISYVLPGGSIADGSYRYTTAGIQGSFRVGYSLIRTEKHMLEFRVGGVLRYQSSSCYDIISVYYPPITGLPMPVSVLQNTSPQRTVAIGGIGQLYYGYNLSGKIRIGVIAGFQIDSNGDSISQLALGVSRIIF